jgi:predicted secreted protein
MPYGWMKDGRKSPAKSEFIAIAGSSHRLVTMCAERGIENWRSRHLEKRV